jgi:hypothetical protein
MTMAVIMMTLRVRQLSEIAVSDRTTLRGLTQFLPSLARQFHFNSLNTNVIASALGTSVDVCDNLCLTARKSLILNGEMSEWLKEHAWKSTRAARADAHQILPTHFRFNDFCNIDVRRSVPVNPGI